MMLTDDLGTGRKAEAKTLRFRSKERTEHACPNVFGDRRSTILHFKEEDLPCRTDRAPCCTLTTDGGNAHEFLIARRSEFGGFDRILHQIEHDLLHLVRIEAAGQILLLDMEIEIHLALFRLED